jgi:hypothetical protein
MSAGNMNAGVSYTPASLAGGFRVLFFSASPEEEVRVRVDKEYSTISKVSGSESLTGRSNVN